MKLNPDLENPTNDISVLPIYISYSWGILKLIKSFNVPNFSFQTDAFHQLMLEIANLDDAKLVLAAIDSFPTSTDPVGQFVLDVNQQYPSLNLAYPPDPDTDTAISNILAAIAQTPNINLYELLFEVYVVNADINQSLENLNQLFQPVVGVITVPLNE